MTRVLLTGLLLLALSPAMAQQRGALFEGADSNGDGAISREEFLAARASQFSQRDRNQDGFIDSADVPAQAASRPRLADGINKAQQRMDSSGDGKVSKDEFVNGGLAMFERADTDGNGTLDSKEVAAAKTAVQQRVRR